MKKSRKKVWMPIVALCSAGLMVGTGYAAWTIARNQSGEATGNRKADTVVDNRISITNIKWYEGSYSDSATSIKGNPTVCFGWKENESQTSAGSWLQHGDADVKENRKFTLYFEVEKAQGATVSYEPKVSFAVEDTSDGVFKACVDAKIIEAPSDSLTAASVSGQADHYTVDVSFKWGTKFGETDGKTKDINPYVYYNEKDANASYPDVLNTLNRLAKLNTSAEEGNNKGKPNFKLTISTIVK